jgi:hypothetical protein
MDALHFAAYSEIMDAGRVRTVLECGNSFKPTCALWRTKIPYAFAVGEPATYVQAPKAKGPGTARFDGFPTPRSRVC